MHESPLIIKRSFNFIGVSAKWVEGRIYLLLKRNGQQIAHKDLFGKFDRSYCQTDVLLNESETVVSQAQIGDELYICFPEFQKATQYVFNIKLQLLNH